MPPILIGDADRGKAATAGFVGGIRNEGVDAMKSQNLFPARLLGFGFYWAWLFLIGVSPSPIVGDVSFAGAPFEIWELGFRLASVAAIVAFARQLSSDGGRKVLLAACFVVGPLGTVSLLAAEGGLVIGSAAPWPMRLRSCCGCASSGICAWARRRSTWRSPMRQGPCSASSS